MRGSSDEFHNLYW